MSEWLDQGGVDREFTSAVIKDVVADAERWAKRLDKLTADQRTGGALMAVCFGAITNLVVSLRKESPGLRELIWWLITSWLGIGLGIKTAQQIRILSEKGGDLDRLMKEHFKNENLF